MPKEIRREVLHQPQEFEQWKEEDVQTIYERLEATNWAPWLVDRPERLAERVRVFPRGQIVLKDEKGLPIACLSTNKLNWDDAPDPAGLPPSWDYCAGIAPATSFESVHEPDGNALVILVINIHPDYKGNRLSQKFLFQAVDLARAEGCDYVIGPFRPVCFGEHRMAGGEDNVSQYAARRRIDGTGNRRTPCATSG